MVSEDGPRRPVVPLLPPPFAAALYRDVDRLRHVEGSPAGPRRRASVEVGTALVIALAVLLGVLACVYVISLFAVPRPAVGAGG